ncbi:MAG: carbohydrate kinase family protein [Candidatus Babeliales bacterium]|jgi:sugar/nucleoside kinase (ribokinase family)
MTKVLTIGAATQDIIIKCPKGTDLSLINNSLVYTAFKQGSKIEIEELLCVQGGGATNSAVSLSKQGFNVKSFFKVGNDQTGKTLIQALEKKGITVNHVVCNQKPTGTSFIVPSDKDRIIFTYRGANTTIDYKELPESIFEGLSGLYITSLSGESSESLVHIIHRARKKDTDQTLKVAVNPGASQLTYTACSLKAALHQIDILILNSDEMKLFMNKLKPRFFCSTGKGIVKEGPPLLTQTVSHEKISFTFYEYCKELLDYGVKRIVVTDGKQGVYVATKDHVFFHPALPVKVVNTVGAGDAFGSTFFGNLLHHNSLETAIRKGIINASSVILHYDAQSGLLTQQELEQQLKLLDTSLLQKFSWP